MLAVVLLLPPVAAQVAIKTWKVGKLGFQLAALGDLDGDGIPDIAATNYQDASYGGTGSVSILSGLDGSVLLTFGTSGVQGYGDALDAAGDVNLDGVPDVLVGAPESSLTKPGSGRAEVRSGADGALLLHWDGVRAQQGMGFDVAGVGDVDGDGHSDVLVPSTSGSPAGPNAGSIQLLSGADGRPLFIDLGQITHEALGFSPEGLGDVDGDGWPDFAYGRIPAPAGPYAQPGSIRIVSGASLTTLVDLPDWVSISAAGDADGDGHADAFLDTYETAPDYVSSIALWSGADGHDFMLATGTLYSPIHAAGDLDLDGWPDAVLYNGDVRSGATGALMCAVDFGTDFAAPGDMDGDGQPELLRGKVGTIQAYAYKPPTLIDLLPHQVTVMGLAGTTMYLQGDFLFLVAHVTVDGVPVLFDHDGPDTLTFELGEPAATGPLAVVVSNSTDTLVSEPIFVELSETHPPQVVVTGIAKTGDTLTWLLFGEPSATGVVLASVNPVTVTVGGWSVLWPSWALAVVPLDALGRGEFELVLPAAAAGILLQSQLVTLDGGLIGSSQLATTLIPF